MTGRTRILLTALTALATLSACADPVSVPAKAIARSPAANQGNISGGRKDTPWQKMEQGELMRELARARGRVIIGLKDSSASEGVNERGQVVVSTQQLETAKQRLRELGVEMLKEFQRMPGIVANVSPQLYKAVRESPWVDYIEPSTPGRFERLVAAPALRLPSQEIPARLSSAASKASCRWRTRMVMEPSPRGLSQLVTILWM